MRNKVVINIFYFGMSPRDFGKLIVEFVFFFTAEIPRTFVSIFDERALVNCVAGLVS